MAPKRKTPARKSATAKPPTAAGAASPGRPVKVALKVPAVKTVEEVHALRASPTLAAGAGRVGACYFKDGGGSEVCVPATQKECDSEGGRWSSGNCHN